jgi:sugar phosphate isomerase/epimerase
MKALRLGTSTYSYWHFTPEKVPIEHVIDQAQALGLAGVEIVQQQLASEENSYLQSLKRYAFRRGVALYNLGTSQDFVWREAEKRAQNVEHTKYCIDLAHKLGVPSIRVNAGWWREDSWEGLLAAKGWVTPYVGCTEDDGFAWAIEGLAACVDLAAEKGVMLLLENHWGLTTTVVNMIRILKGVNSPWLRAILDMGNFYFEPDMLAAVRQIAPYVDLAHAKTYPGGGLVYTLDLDYTAMFRILLEAGFGGYVSLEMEGHEAAVTAVPKSITLLQEAWVAAH